MEALETIIGYRFTNADLLKEALTHPSLAYVIDKVRKDNQRLEFLGDAVLQMILTERLFEMFPHFPEGRLTKLRARLVSGAALGDYSRSMELGEHLIMSKGEEASGGRARASSLADVFESLVGAIYLDGGYVAAKGVVLNKCSKWIDQVELSPDEHNPKGKLQEILQALSPESPEYRVLSSTGPDHDKFFEIKVVWKDQLLGKGQGNSKKAAETDAASNALSEKLWETSSS